MYKHFLITRFNVSNILDARWQTTKAGNKLLTEEWLTERFRLFETYCFPSVKNQTNLNFQWCVFFDTNTPDRFQTRIQKLAETFETFRPVFIDGGAAFQSTMKNIIRAAVMGEDKFVITSRVDNDDILHKDFIATIQQLFKPIDNHLINLYRGYQLVTEETGSEIYEFQWRSNPFISLIETADGELNTVYARNHDRWAKAAKSITNYCGSRLWMVLIHRNNVFNAKKAYLKAVYKLNHDDFGIAEKDIQLKPLLNIWFHNLWSHKVMQQLSLFKKRLTANFKEKKQLIGSN